MFLLFGFKLLTNFELKVCFFIVVCTLYWYCTVQFMKPKAVSVLIKLLTLNNTVNKSNLWGKGWWRGRVLEGGVVKGNGRWGKGEAGWPTWNGVGAPSVLLFIVFQELVALSAQNKELCSKLSNWKRYFGTIF